MVGEIRDLETAEIAMQASLTGHLVLSTLHTNDAPSALVRLIDMGIEPFLVASSLTVVLAQRLVRTICPGCKESYEPSAVEESYFSSYISRPSSLRLYRGKGCDKCKGNGYFGRIGIFELLVIDNDIRPMITDKMDSQSIKNEAVSRGMKTLRQDGIEKVVSGVTTLEEVLRVTQKDYADISV
jgi:general secretion pathway protein E